MPRIYVEYAKMSQLSNDLASTSAKIDTIRSDLKSTIQQLDWDIKFQSNINSNANKIALKLERYSQVLKKYKQFIVSAQLSYRELDNERFDNNILGRGVLYGGTNSGGSSATSANAGWLGVEYADDHPGITAYIGKASAEAKNDWGYAGVNAYLGKAEAGVKADAGFMKASSKKKYQDGEWTEKETLDLLFAEIGAGATVSAIAGDAKAGIGNDMLGAEAGADGRAGNATAEVKGEFSIGEDGVNAVASGKAIVSAVEGKASGTINILGIEITGKIGGYAGAAGIEGKIGIENNKWVMEGGLAALVGVNAGIEIGFNDEGWSNFVDFITFWD